MIRLVIILVVLFIPLDIHSMEVDLTDIASQIGADVNALKKVEKASQIRLDRMCLQHGCSELNPVINSCSINPLPNTCVILAFYKQAMILELCENDLYCMKAHRENELKFISFYEDKAADPGIGRTAVNICSPLHRFHSQNELIQEIEAELGIVQVFIEFFDFTSYFECISDTYKRLSISASN